MRFILKSVEKAKDFIDAWTSQRFGGRMIFRKELIATTFHQG